MPLSPAPVGIENLCTLLLRGSRSESPLITAWLRVLAAQMGGAHVRDLLDKNSQMTGRDVLADLESRFDHAVLEARRLESELIERAVCRHCGYPIRQTGSDGWWHDSGAVGCRAASFDRNDEWDDALDKRWKATPA
jgi:hypothetical protein